MIEKSKYYVISFDGKSIEVVGVVLLLLQLLFDVFARRAYSLLFLDEWFVQIHLLWNIYD